MKTGIGLDGVNGHQVTRHLEKHTSAQLLAVAGIEPDKLPESFRNDNHVKRYGTLAELLKDPKVELVSLCSPRRRDQADDAIACLRAGKHVYAEKPAAMTEADLDRILATVKDTGKHFHEMAGSVFHQPFLGMRKVVQSGILGTVVQVFAQKSIRITTAAPSTRTLTADSFARPASTRCVSSNTSRPSRSNGSKPSKPGSAIRAAAD